MQKSERLSNLFYFCGLIEANSPNRSKNISVIVRLEKN